MKNANQSVQAKLSSMLLLQELIAELRDIIFSLLYAEVGLLNKTKGRKIQVILKIEFYFIVLIKFF